MKWEENILLTSLVVLYLALGSLREDDKGLCQALRFKAIQNPIKVFQRKALGPDRSFAFVERFLA